MKTTLLVLYALIKNGYLIPEQIIKYTNNMKTPKYSVGDVFHGGPIILYVDDTEADDIYYCLTSYHQGYPPVYCSEKELDEHYLLGQTRVI